MYVTEREQRLLAIQDRWDSLRQAKAALAREDYAAAMRTGVVCRRIRWVGGKDGREVVEYEINTALIESLNSVEKRAAIETGQEVDRQDISLNSKANARVDVLAKAFSLEELEAIMARPGQRMIGRRTGMADIVLLLRAGQVSIFFQKANA